MEDQSFIAIIEAQYPEALVVDVVAVVLFMAVPVVLDLARLSQGAFFLPKRAHRINTGIVETPIEFLFKPKPMLGVFDAQLSDEGDDARCSTSSRGGCGLVVNDASAQMRFIEIVRQRRIVAFFDKKR